MFKYTATYDDPFTGEPTTEDVYCNLIAPELAKLELGFEGGFGEYVKKVLASNDGKQIFQMFESLVGTAYGRRSEDGKHFAKRKEWTEEFLVSQAWESMFLWLTEKSDGSNANAFWNGVVPKKLNDEITRTTNKAITDLSKDELLALWQEKTAANEQNQAPAFS